MTSDDASSVAGSDEFFKEARETLAYDRNEMISVLTDTIDNAGEGSEKNSAKEQKDKIIKYMDMEKSLENLIRSKGYSDAFVIVTDKSVNVTVQADSIDDQDAARIPRYRHARDRQKCGRYRGSGEERRGVKAAGTEFASL